VVVVPVMKEVNVPNMVVEVAEGHLPVMTTDRMGEVVYMEEVVAVVVVVLREVNMGVMEGLGVLTQQGVQITEVQQLGKMTVDLELVGDMVVEMGVVVQEVEILEEMEEMEVSQVVGEVVLVQEVLVKLVEMGEKEKYESGHGRR
jgi:hypothetical protein